MDINQKTLEQMNAVKDELAQCPRRDIEAIVKNLSEDEAKALLCLYIWDSRS